MIEGWLLSWQALPMTGAWLVALAFHLILYLAWGSGIAASYWFLREKLGAGRVLDERPFFPAQLRTELARGVSNCAVVAVVTVACLGLADSALPSAVRIALELAGLVALYEVTFYFLHRLLHTRPFQGVHGIHHKSVRTTPWSGLSVHPIEGLFIEAPILLFALLAPVSIATLIIFQVLLHYISAVGHGNFDPFGRLSGPGWLQSYLRMHQLHHAHGAVNYSTFTPLMDRIFATHEA